MPGTGREVWRFFRRCATDFTLFCIRSVWVTMPWSREFAYQCSRAKIRVYFYWWSFSYDSWFFWPFLSSFAPGRYHDYWWCHQISLEDGRISWIPRKSRNILWNYSNRWRWWNYVYQKIISEIKYDIQKISDIFVHPSYGCGSRIAVVCFYLLL